MELRDTLGSGALVQPAPGTGPAKRAFEWYPWLLGVVVFAARAFTSGPAYFADGPEHLEAVWARSFVIQPPGYWLFNRGAGLFRDPELAIAVFNWLCSAAGVVALYFCARLLMGPRLAKWSAALYGAVFYAWFSGNVHSTYASQLLFPPLFFYFLLLHREGGRFAHLIAATFILGVGAGLRPTDGVFLMPLFLYYLARSVSRREFVYCLLMTAGFGLLWIVPTVLAYRKTDEEILIWIVRPWLFTRPPTEVVANSARFFIPLTVAFWPLMPSVAVSLRRDDEITKLLWLWVIPGATFFLAIYMSVAPYLDFLTAAVVLLGSRELARRKVAWAHALLAISIACNLVVYLTLSPIPSRRLVTNVFNAYVATYTRYAVRNQYWVVLAHLHDPRTLAPLSPEGDKKDAPRQ